MKILLAADGSAYTRHAVDYLIKHPGMFGGQPELRIVHVRPMIPGRAATALSKSVIQKYYADETAKALAPARRMLDKAGFQYTVSQLIGDPGSEVAALAKKGKFDLVVMGSHGHGALGSLVLGSAASKVLAQCKVPVFIVR